MLPVNIAQNCTGYVYRQEKEIYKLMIIMNNSSSNNNNNNNNNNNDNNNNFRSAQPKPERSERQMTIIEVDSSSLLNNC